MPKHTPGDWVQSDTDPTWIMAGRIHVATIPRAHDGDWSRANARLITAAPELLEALTELMDVLIDGEWGTHAHGLAERKARAAISKATAE